MILPILLLILLLGKPIAKHARSFLPALGAVFLSTALRPLLLHHRTLLEGPPSHWAPQVGALLPGTIVLLAGAWWTIRLFRNRAPVFPNGGLPPYGYRPLSTRPR